MSLGGLNMILHKLMQKFFLFAMQNTFSWLGPYFVSHRICWSERFGSVNIATGSSDAARAPG